MPVLNQVTAGDSYQTTAAKLLDVWNTRGGWFSVTGNSAFVMLEYGERGEQHFTDEIELGVGAFAFVPPNCVGVQFRNATPGSPAIITCQLAQGDEPALSISALGTLNVSNLNVNFQHNDVLVAAEPTLDLEDGAGVLTWTVVDDAPSTRVKVTPGFPDPVKFPGAATTGGLATSSLPQTIPGDVLNANGQAVAIVGLAATSALNLAVVNDTQYRWTAAGDGTLRWGPGNAATDQSVARQTGMAPSSGGTGLVFSGTVYATSTPGYVYQGAANNLAFQSYLAAADANPAFSIFGNGAFLWGPGGASASDLEQARVVNSPTGTGTFLELVKGQGLGYGTGVGGTGTDVGGAVTINKPTGQITVASTTITAGTAYSITVTNSCVGADDTVIVNYAVEGPGTLIPVTVTAVSAGSFRVSIQNLSAGSVVTGAGSKLNFAVIKGAVA